MALRNHGSRVCAVLQTRTLRGGTSWSLGGFPTLWLHIRLRALRFLAFRRLFRRRWPGIPGSLTSRACGSTSSRHRGTAGGPAGCWTSGGCAVVLRYERGGELVTGGSEPLVAIPSGALLPDIGEGAVEERQESKGGFSKSGDRPGRMRWKWDWSDECPPRSPTAAAPVDGFRKRYVGLALRFATFKKTLKLCWTIALLTVPTKDVGISSQGTS